MSESVSPPAPHAAASNGAPVHTPGASDDQGTDSTPVRRLGRGSKSGGPVLGVHVTAQTIYAVLMRPAGDTYEPVRQFSRQRSASGASEPASLDTLTPDAGPLTSEDDGVTVQFGGGMADPFLDSEFSNYGDSGGESLSMAPESTGSPIVFELKDILEECSAAGFDRPDIAFVVGAPDVDYVEVTVPSEGDKKGKKDSGGSVKRERLLALLTSGGATYDKERVAFVPMTARDSQQRYLAVAPSAGEPVARSLSLLREQQGMKRISFRLMTAEVPVLIGMARLVFPTSPDENTAIVRVGAEDTLVILLQGNQLHHCDHMRSVTTFDGPDTICSRVLLQQDVQGVGTVHNVVVISDEREDELVQGFAAFYPDARVETLRAGMAKMGVAGPYGPLPTQSMEPAGAALKALMRDAPFEDVNMLPKALRRRARRAPKLALSFAWHTLLVGILLFGSVVFFVGQYFMQQSEIAEAEQRLAEFPAQATMSAGQLQMRIDSLRLAQQRINSSLQILDSLLVGTDQWSQTLARTSTATSGAGGVWVESWDPSGRELSIDGFATSRDNVVRLAGRLNASIEELTFREIREHPVYEYRMRFSMPYELPASVRYLREQSRDAMPVPAPQPEPLADTVPLN